jgi:hypothetical protein
MAFSACASEGPERPTFQDVMPIVAANCVRCHAYPPIGGAPEACAADGNGIRWCGFRLDSYDDVIVDDGDPDDPRDDVGVRGAASVAVVIPSRVRDARAPMPPRFPLEDEERDLLIAWARGEPPSREPRPGNLAPALEVEAEASGAAVTVRYVLRDPDADLVVGTLRARGPGGDVFLVGPLQSGRDELVWDTALVPSGSYALSASVDDGGERRVLDAGTVTVVTP